jgi:hypothetical protein
MLARLQRPITSEHQWGSVRLSGAERCCMVWYGVCRRTGEAGERARCRARVAQQRVRHLPSPPTHPTHTCRRPPTHTTHPTHTPHPRAAWPGLAGPACVFGAGGTVRRTSGLAVRARASEPHTPHTPHTALRRASSAPLRPVGAAGRGGPPARAGSSRSTASMNSREVWLMRAATATT